MQQNTATSKAFAGENKCLGGVGAEMCILSFMCPGFKMCLKTSTPIYKGGGLHFICGAEKVLGWSDHGQRENVKGSESSFNLGHKLL